MVTLQGRESFLEFFRNRLPGFQLITIDLAEISF